MEMFLYINHNINHMKASHVFTIVIWSIILAGILSYFSINYFSNYHPTIRQGIYGRVTQLSGNCMPYFCGGLIDCLFRKSSCNVVHLSKTIYITSPIDDFTANHDNLLENITIFATVQSDKNGYYQAELPPGLYSVVIEDMVNHICGYILHDTASDRYICSGVNVVNGLNKYDIDASTNVAI